MEEKTLLHAGSRFLFQNIPLRHTSPSSIIEVRDGHRILRETGKSIIIKIRTEDLFKDINCYLMFLNKSYFVEREGGGGEAKANIFF